MDELLPTKIEESDWRKQTRDFWSEYFAI